jgi:hypothetical protein
MTSCVSRSMPLATHVVNGTLALTHAESRCWPWMSQSSSSKQTMPSATRHKPAFMSSAYSVTLRLRSLRMTFDLLRYFSAISGVISSSVTVGCTDVAFGGVAFLGVDTFVATLASMVRAVRPGLVT